MKVLVLSALGLDASFGDATLSLLEEALAERRHQAETVDCERLHVSPCTGCASCGLKTPGRGVIKDDMQDIFRKILASDVLVLATPVRFGSSCAQLKRIIDRFQPLMVPMYVVRDGEMHFRGRYDLPALLGVGLVADAVGAERAAEEAEAFRFLVGRLALNIDTPHASAAFAGSDADLARAELAQAVGELAEVVS